MRWTTMVMPMTDKFTQGSTWQMWKLCPGTQHRLEVCSDDIRVGWCSINWNWTRTKLNSWSLHPGILSPYTNESSQPSLLEVRLRACSSLHNLGVITDSTMSNVKRSVYHHLRSLLKFAPLTKTHASGRVLSQSYPGWTMQTPCCWDTHWQHCVGCR